MSARLICAVALLAGCASFPGVPAGGLVVDVDRVIVSDGTVLLCEVHGEPCAVGWSVAISTLAASSPGLVQLHPAVARKAAGPLKFIFLHELGHLHAPMGEPAADCWAAMRAEELRVMRGSDWSDVQKQLEGEPGRWRGIVACRGAK